MTVELNLTKVYYEYMNIYGNVTMKSPVKLIYANKIFKNANSLGIS
jgi:hypothetical protein